jgi:hypothetical protein
MKIRFCSNHGGNFYIETKECRHYQVYDRGGSRRIRLDGDPDKDWELFPWDKEGTDFTVYKLATPPDPNQLAANPPTTKEQLLEAMHAHLDGYPQYRRMFETAKLVRVTKGVQKNGTPWFSKGDFCLAWPERGSAYSWRPLWPTHKLDGTPRRDAEYGKGKTDVVGMCAIDSSHYKIVESING